MATQLSEEDIIRDYDKINGFSEVLLLKLINYTFNDNFNFNTIDKKIMESNRPTSEMVLNFENNKYILKLDIDDSLYRTKIYDVMEGDYSDDFKHNLLLAVNNLVGMVKMTYQAIKDRYSLLDEYNMTVGDDLSIFLDKDIDKRLCLHFEKSE